MERISWSYSSDRHQRTTKTNVYKDASTSQKDDKLAIVFNDLMLNAAEENYENAKATMHPEDPRMKIRKSALWTWVLKVLGMIENFELHPRSNSSSSNLVRRALGKSSVAFCSSRRSKNSTMSNGLRTVIFTRNAEACSSKMSLELPYARLRSLQMGGQKG